MTERDSLSNENGLSSTAMRFGTHRLLKSQRLLLDGARPVPISNRAMDVLLTLVERPGRVISRDDLIMRAWPNTKVDDINLRVHVSLLRRTLGDSRDSQPYLVTVPDRGYRFVGPLASEPAPLLPMATSRVRLATLPLP
jgi:DNA-binding winged helix-turn-helix (wHTH) protein